MPSEQVRPPFRSATKSRMPPTSVQSDDHLLSMRGIIKRFPGVLALVLLVVTANLAAMAVVREKELGTLEQLNVTPLRRWELIVGKLLPYGLIAMVDVLLVVAVAVGWFQIPLRGSLLLDGVEPGTLFTGERHAPAVIGEDERHPARPLEFAPRPVRLDFPDWLADDLAALAAEGERHWRALARRTGAPARAADDAAIRRARRG